MKIILKRLLIACFFILLLIQLIPRKNNNISNIMSSTSIEQTHAVPDSVLQILKSSCYDCHSNNTVYPWYSNIQPVSLWLKNHIEEGKEELNFAVFGSYSIRRQFHKLEEISNEVEEGEMPLTSYTIIHRDTKIDQYEKSVISKWVKSLRDSFNMAYPPDSLIRKRRA